MLNILAAVTHKEHREITHISSIDFSLTAVLLKRAFKALLCIAIFPAVPGLLQYIKVTLELWEKQLTKIHSCPQWQPPAGVEEFHWWKELFHPEEPHSGLHINCPENKHVGKYLYEKRRKAKTSPFSFVAPHNYFSKCSDIILYCCLLFTMLNRVVNGKCVAWHCHHNFKSTVTYGFMLHITVLQKRAFKAVECNEEPQGNLPTNPSN